MWDWQLPRNRHCVQSRQPPPEALSLAKQSLSQLLKMQGAPFYQVLLGFWDCAGGEMCERQETLGTLFPSSEGKLTPGLLPAAL